MTRSPARRTTAVVCVLAASAAALLAACGGDAASAPVPASAVTMDQRLHDRLPAKIKASKVLVVGTDASYAPASSFGPDGRTIIGFEPDLGKEIGKVLGVQLKFTTVDFTDITALLQRDEIDLGISAMTDTAEREKKLDFVNYFSAGTSVVVQRGNPSGVSDVKDLCGKVVAVETGTTQVDLLKRTQANCTSQPITVKTYPTNSDALVQLRTGRVTAVLNDYPPASFLVNDARTKAHYQLASTTQYEPGLYGIAVSKADVQLRDVVRDALDSLIRSGKYAEVLTRWNVQDGAVASATVNTVG